MKTVSKVTGFTLASAAAALLLAGCSTSGDGANSASMSKKMADVKCGGINSCKGTSACATATSSCKGLNACKGQGWIKASASDCSEKGGKVLGQA